MPPFPCRLDQTEVDKLDLIEKLTGSTTRNGTIKEMINTYCAIHQANLDKDAEIRKLTNEIKRIKYLISQQQQYEQAERELKERTEKALVADRYRA